MFFVVSVVYFYKIATCSRCDNPRSESVVYEYTEKVLLCTESGVTVSVNKKHHYC